jgi:hypothetical protein
MRVEIKFELSHSLLDRQIAAVVSRINALHVEGLSAYVTSGNGEAVTIDHQVLHVIIPKSEREDFDIYSYVFLLGTECGKLMAL